MDQHTLAKQSKNALERLEQLEQQLPQIVSGINQSFTQFGTQLTAITEVLEVLMQREGTELVQNLVLENKRKRDDEKSAAEKKALDDMLLQGILVPAEKITEKSIFVGKETEKDGTVRHPGRAQVPFQKLGEEFKAALLGQAVGFKLTLPHGGTFEVQEIYEVNPVAPPVPVPSATVTPEAVEAVTDTVTTQPSVSN